MKTALAIPQAGNGFWSSETMDTCCILLVTTELRQMKISTSDPSQGETAWPQRWVR